MLRTFFHWYARRHDFVIVSREKWILKCSLANDAVNLRTAHIPKLKKQFQGLVGHITAIRQIVGIPDNAQGNTLKAVKTLRNRVQDLRQAVADRDAIIVALREAAEGKVKSLDEVEAGK